MVKNIKWKGIRNEKGRLIAWKVENFGLSMYIAPINYKINFLLFYFLKFY